MIVPCTAAVSLKKKILLGYKGGSSEPPRTPLATGLNVQTDAFNVAAPYARAMTFNRSQQSEIEETQPGITSFPCSVGMSLNEASSELIGASVSVWHAVRNKNT